MNNLFPQTSTQQLSPYEILNTFLPKNFWSDGVSGQLQANEDSDVVGTEGDFVIRRIIGSRDLIQSSSIHVLTILEHIEKSKQIGPRAGSMEKIIRGVVGDKLEEDVALYRIDGGAINIVRSVALLRKFGIELGHSWTVICLRTRENIRSILEERQKLGIPEILIAGHARNIGIDEKMDGNDTDIFYARDTFTTTSLDITYPVPDGSGFKPGTILFAGVKSNTSQGVLQAGEKLKSGSDEEGIPEEGDLVLGGTGTGIKNS